MHARVQQLGGRVLSASAQQSGRVRVVPGCAGHEIPVPVAQPRGVRTARECRQLGGDDLRVLVEGFKSHQTERIVGRKGSHLHLQDVLARLVLHGNGALDAAVFLTGLLDDRQQGLAEQRHIRKPDLAAFGQQVPGHRLHRVVRIGDAHLATLACHDENAGRHIVYGGIDQLQRRVRRRSLPIRDAGLCDGLHSVAGVRS